MNDHTTQSYVRAVLDAEREQWTGPTDKCKPGDPSEGHASALRICQEVPEVRITRSQLDRENRIVLIACAVVSISVVAMHFLGALPS